MHLVYSLCELLFLYCLYLCLRSNSGLHFRLRMKNWQINFNLESWRTMVLNHMTLDLIWPDTWTKNVLFYVDFKGRGMFCGNNRMDTRKVGHPGSRKNEYQINVNLLTKAVYFWPLMAFHIAAVKLVAALSKIASYIIDHN